MVADQIRDLIIRDDLHLGEQLSENALADKLGVSRTPVREAFLVLASERLVEVRPQRGTFVFRCDATEIRELCELREVLEEGALRLGYERGGAALLETLVEIVTAGEAVSARSPAEYQLHDHAFHQAIVDATANRELQRAYARVSGRVRSLRYRYTRTIEEVSGSQAGHRAILEALQRDDLDGAALVMRDHVYSSLRNFERRFAERDDAQDRGDTEIEESRA